MPIWRAALRYMSGVDLLGTKNGVNRVFTTPDTFMQDDRARIKVYHNGRRLVEATTVAMPNDGEFFASESIPGNGYDTVTILAFAPVATSELRADYALG
jgi:hypothetical protein